MTGFARPSGTMLARIAGAVLLLAAMPLVAGLILLVLIAGAVTGLTSASSRGRGSILDQPSGTAPVGRTLDGDYRVVRSDLR